MVNKKSLAQLKTDKDRKWAGYCRVSSAKQEQLGVSLDAQKQAITNYAKAKELKLVDIFTERCSGTVPMTERHQFKRIIEGMENGTIDGLLVCKFDRLSRNLKDLITIVEQYFTKGSSRVIFLDCDHLDLKDPHAIFQMNLYGSISQLERDMIAKRTVTALAYKKTKSEKLGGLIPWGYQLKTTDGDKKVLEESPNEKKLLKELVKKHEEEKVSFNKLAAWLTKRGEVNRSGKVKWDGTQVLRMMYPDRCPRKTYNRQHKD